MTSSYYRSKADTYTLTVNADITSYPRAPAKTYKYDEFEGHSCSLGIYGGVQFNPEVECKYYDEILDAQYRRLNIGICTSDYSGKMYDYFENTKRLHTINLEPLKWDIVDDGTDWTVPRAEGHYYIHEDKRREKEAKEKYQVAEKKVTHCVRRFVKEELCCNPKGTIQVSTYK